jgi:hypothetical protein
MPKAMNQFAKILTLLLALIACPSPGRAEGSSCAASWSTKEYKSFGDLQSEVKKRYGEVRILRVALCDKGGNPYFQVVIISGQGEVRRIQVSAAN